MMKYSKIALKMLAAQELKLINSRSHFYKNFYDIDLFEEMIQKNSLKINKAIEQLELQLEDSFNDEGFICVFDKSFPVINKNVNDGAKPYLLFYKGNINLLEDLNKNVAVIGQIDPTENIIKRERNIVKKLIENELIIVSGLAKGCDTVAHEVCVENGKPTIAILPSQINQIFPSENTTLAEEIVKNNGLLLSEYYKKPNGRFDAINRFIERDRLQSMFSKAIVLISSYKKDEGDSGSRHAMEAAKKYGINRYVMFDNNSDLSDSMFGLNEKLLNEEKGFVKQLTNSSIAEIKNIFNNNLEKQSEERYIYEKLF